MRTIRGSPTRAIELSHALATTGCFSMFLATEPPAGFEALAGAGAECPDLAGVWEHRAEEEPVGRAHRRASSPQRWSWR